MTFLKSVTLVFLLVSYSTLACAREQASVLKEQIIATNKAITQAFVQGDIDDVARYHHPEVKKYLAWDNVQHGELALRQNLVDLFENNRIEFLNDPRNMESLTFTGDTAVMVSKFEIRGIPKSGDAKPWRGAGRTMIVYARHPKSPTGWVIHTEMIMGEPAND